MLKNPFRPFLLPYIDISMCIWWDNMIFLMICTKLARLTTLRVPNHVHPVIWFISDLFLLRNNDLCKKKGKGMGQSYKPQPVLTNCTFLAPTTILDTIFLFILYIRGISNYSTKYYNHIDNSLRAIDTFWSFLLFCTPPNPTFLHLFGTQFNRVYLRVQ